MDIHPPMVEIYASAECINGGIPIDHRAYRQHLNVLHANVTAQSKHSPSRPQCNSDTAVHRTPSLSGCTRMINNYTNLNHI